MTSVRFSGWGVELEADSVWNTGKLCTIFSLNISHFYGELTNFRFRYSHSSLQQKSTSFTMFDDHFILKCHGLFFFLVWMNLFSITKEIYFVSHAIKEEEKTRILNDITIARVKFKFSLMLFFNFMWIFNFI